jgi:hypothetical protein
VGTKVLIHDRHDWAHKCRHARGMSGHESAEPLRGMFYPSSAGTLTSVKRIETCVESNFATECVQSAIAGHFFCFGEDG